MRLSRRGATSLRQFPSPSKMHRAIASCALMPRCAGKLDGLDRWLPALIEWPRGQGAAPDLAPRFRYTSQLRGRLLGVVGSESDKVAAGKARLRSLRTTLLVLSNRTLLSSTWGAALCAVLPATFVGDPECRKRLSTASRTSLRRTGLVRNYSAPRRMPRRCRTGSVAADRKTNGIAAAAA